MARVQTLTDGQLAATATSLLSGATVADQKVQIVCVNTGTGAETVIVTQKVSGGTARQVARSILGAKETLIVTGIGMHGDDTLLGQTTNATTVDYVVSTCPSDEPFEIESLDANGALKMSNNSYVRTGYTTQLGTRAKVGGGAGWVVAGADNLPYVGTMAASQTAGTLIIPIDGLHLGDTITGFKVIAQIESAGGVVTLDADLRAVTNVAAEPTDASIGTIAQVSVTADTAVAEAKTGLNEVVTSGRSYYLKITGTTAASTDVILQHCELTVSTS